MKIKTSELIGEALDWAVCQAEGDELAARNIEYPEQAKYFPKISPSTNWSLAGPIIEREKIEIVRGNDLIFPKGNEKGEYIEPLWFASCGGGRMFHGQTSLIAAMRCYVASRLGDEIKIPEKLTHLPTNRDTNIPT